MAIKILLFYIFIGVILSIFGCAKADIDLRADSGAIVLALLVITLIWPAFFVAGLFYIVKELKEKR